MGNVVSVVALPSDRHAAEMIVSILISEQIDASLLILDAPMSQNRDDVSDILSSRCALFCWGGVAATNATFLALARHAVRNAIAIGVQLSRDAAPQLAPAMTIYHLTRWHLFARIGLLRVIVGQEFLRDIITAVQNKVAGLDPPPPTSRSLVVRKTSWRLVTAFGTLILTAGGLKQSFDYIPWPHPGDNRAWQSIKSGEAGSCSDLQSYIRDYPQGAHADEAHAALENPTTRPHWVTRTRPQPLPAQLPTGKGVASEFLARERLSGQMDHAAEGQCVGLAETIDARLISATVRFANVQCERLAAGWICYGDGQAVCTLSAPEAERVCEIRAAR